MTRSFQRRWSAALLALAAAQAVCAQVATNAPPVATSTPQVAVDPLTIGRAAYEDGFYDLAQRTFAQAAQLLAAPAPRTEARLWQARALLALHRAADARAVLTDCQTEARGGEHEAAWTYLSALAHFEVGQLAEASVLIRDFDTRYPNSPENVRALRLAANVLLKQGQPEPALALFEQVQKKAAQSPEAAENLWQWAEALLALKRADAARGVLEKLVAEKPETPFADQARLRLADLYGQAQQGPQAEQMLKALTARAKARPDLRLTAWNQLARFYESQTNLAAAVQALAQSAALVTDPAAKLRTELLRGKLLFRLGRDDEGAKALRDIVRQPQAGALAAEAQLELADQLLLRKRYEQALAEFQAYVEAFAEPAGQRRALLGKGWCLWHLARYDEAAAAFGKAGDASNSPAGIAEARFKEADSWFAAQQYRRALPLYLTLTNALVSAQSAQALYQAGLCQMRLGQAAEAERLFTALTGAQTNGADAARAWLGLALVREDQGRWPQAVAAYDQAAHLTTGTTWQAQALSGRGLLLYRTSHFDAALATFDELLKKVPADRLAEQAFYMRGWCLYLMRREAEALQIARDFIAKYPQSAWAPDVHFWLGEYYFNHAAYADAERQFAGLAQAHPKSELADKALFWAGRAAAAAGQYVHALEHYNRLVKLHPDSPKLAETRFAQGDALSELNKFADAILVFEELIKKFPNSYLANLARGRRGDCAFTLANEDKQRFAEALSDYRAVLDSPTADRDLKWQAEYKVGRCLEKQGKTAEALERYLAVVYAFLGERAKGRHGDPLWFTRAAFNAAEIQEKAGDWRKAVQVYQRVVEAGVPAAQEALQRLQRIKLEHWMLF
jgi:TolA-binding protein